MCSINNWQIINAETIFLCGSFPEKIRTTNQLENWGDAVKTNLILSFDIVQKRREKVDFFYQKKKRKLGWLTWYFEKLVKHPEMHDD